jgi:predicted ATPase
MKREANLQISLAGQLIVARGNADPGVEAAVARARELCQMIGDERLLIRTLRTLLTFHLVRGNIGQANDICVELMAMLPRFNDPDLALQTHRPYGLCLLYMGRFEDARHALCHALDLYDPVHHAGHRFEYGSDPAVLAHAHLGWVEWFLGQSGAAQMQAQIAVDSARVLGHPHSLCFALSFQACLEQFQGRPEEVLNITEEINKTAESLDYVYWIAWSKILRGWAIGMLSDGLMGERMLREGLADYLTTNAGLLEPYSLGLLAEILPAARRDEALSLLDMAIAIAQKCSILFCYPRLSELRAALASQMTRSQPNKAT